MKQFEIQIFVIRKNGIAIQADGIEDGYNLVSAYNIDSEDKNKYGIFSSESEAKDITGEYGPYTLEIETKKIKI